MNTDLDRFDRIVAIASAHNQKLIPVLTDDRGSCGDPEGVKTDRWYARGFRDRFMPWLREVVDRYRNEPAIGMWELVNEPGGKTGNIRRFFDAAGGEIHRLDPNHLVESGAHAPWAYGGPKGWRSIHESRGIDVTSLHEYDMNAGASPHLTGALTQADALGKPLILGEVGIFASTNGDPAQSQNRHPCLSFADRVTTFRAKLDATFRTRIDGVNVWNWMPLNKETCRLETYPGDPLVAMIRTYVLPEPR
jgi:endo-1,4-beta-mannosidase